MKIHIKTDNQEKELNISKVTRVILESNKQNFVYFDELKDGTFRCVYSNNLLNTIKEDTHGV